MLAAAQHMSGAPPCTLRRPSNEPGRRAAPIGMQYWTRVRIAVLLNSLRAEGVTARERRVIAREQATRFGGMPLKCRWLYRLTSQAALEYCASMAIAARYAYVLAIEKHSFRPKAAMERSLLLSKIWPVDRLFVPLVPPAN
ncbi:hypothetical protein Purlil1_1763 [Purpureocillium lilacinum]|uniref:Uncharacterized protein n=1 Tax=Purpureocillium lilacinum TaxID=33203 RepID=A0ABR0CDS3_PURLI|nr:hypothetical protein Purlil1_1763 [Purpureocillium lilacinum]